MYALLILDMQVGLLHGPEKPRAAEALLDTLNKLLSKARSVGAPIFFARHIGPLGSPIEPGNPLTHLVSELVVEGDEVIFEKKRPNTFEKTDLAINYKLLALRVWLSQAGKLSIASTAPAVQHVIWGSRQY